MLYLSEEVPYLTDGIAVGDVEISESGTFSARLTSIGRADFGELIEIEIDAI